MHHRASRRSKVQDLFGIVTFILLIFVAGWGPRRLAGWISLGVRSGAQSSHAHSEISGAPASPEDLAAAAKSHRVYGHALVPGGIHSVDELIALILSDPLLADHYKSFELAQTHFIILDHDVPAYVSYRLAHKIYWTSHQTVIHKGELVITDGSNFIRARCGNRISYIPGFPINPAEPTDLDIVGDPKFEEPAAPAASPPISLHPAPAPPVFVPFLPWVPPPCCVVVPYPPSHPRRWPPAVSADEFPAVYLTVLGHAVRISSELAALALGILLVLGLHFFGWSSQPRPPG